MEIWVPSCICEICPIELVMAVQQEEGWRRVARELAALGLWALAFYALLSLVSHDARYDPNFGGALGDGLARTLERTFGYQAYALVPLLACLGRAVWAATPIRLLLRYTAGGAILLVAQHGERSLPHPGGVAGRCHRHHDSRRVTGQFQRRQSH